MRLVLAGRQVMFLDALGSALRRHGVDVVSTCSSELPELCSAVGRSRPDVCVIDPGSTDRRQLEGLRGLKATSEGTVVVLLVSVITEAAWALYDQGDVDALVSQGVAVEGLVLMLGQAAAGMRPTDGFRRPEVVHRPAPPRLTGRENEVLRLMAVGASTERMAATMGVSTNTVRTHAQSVLRKLGVSRRGQAVRRAVDIGIITGAA